MRAGDNEVPVPEALVIFVARETGGEVKMELPITFQFRCATEQQRCGVVIFVGTGAPVTVQAHARIMTDIQPLEDIVTRRTMVDRRSMKSAEVPAIGGNPLQV